MSCLLEKSDKVIDRNQILSDVISRERISKVIVFEKVSVPHSRTSGVTDLCASIGIRHLDENANSMIANKVLTPIFVMVAWPKDTAHNLSELGRLIQKLSNERVVNQLLCAKTPEMVKDCISRISCGGCCY